MSSALKGIIGLHFDILFIDADFRKVASNWGFAEWEDQNQNPPRVKLSFRHAPPSPSRQSGSGP